MMITIMLMIILILMMITMMLMMILILMMITMMILILIMVMMILMMITMMLMMIFILIMITMMLMMILIKIMILIMICVLILMTIMNYWWYLAIFWFTIEQQRNFLSNDGIILVQMHSWRDYQILFYIWKQCLEEIDLSYSTNNIYKDWIKYIL